MDGLFRKVDCHSLPVDDLDRVLVFYQNKFGHALIWRSESAADLRLPDSNPELVLHTAGRPGQECGQINCYHPEKIIGLCSPE